MFCRRTLHPEDASRASNLLITFAPRPHYDPNEISLGGRGRTRGLLCAKPCRRGRNTGFARRQSGRAPCVRRHAPRKPAHCRLRAAIRRRLCNWQPQRPGYGAGVCPTAFRRLCVCKRRRAACQRGGGRPCTRRLQGGGRHKIRHSHRVGQGIRNGGDEPALPRVYPALQDCAGRAAAWRCDIRV